MEKPNSFFIGSSLTTAIRLFKSLYQKNFFMSAGMSVYFNLVKTNTKFWLGSRIFLLFRGPKAATVHMEPENAYHQRESERSTVYVMSYLQFPF